MILNEIKCILSDGKYIRGLAVLLLLSALLLVFTEKQDPLSGKYLYEGRKIFSSGYSEEKIQAARNSALSGSGSLISGSLYEEYMLLDELERYFNRRISYKSIISSYISEQKYIQNFRLSGREDKARAALLEEKYAVLKDTELSEGSYLSAEKYLKNGKTEFMIFLAMILTVWYLVIRERERGIGNLINSVPKGGLSYYFSKMIAMFLMTGISVLLFSFVKLAVYSVMYGVCDLENLVQNLDVYYSCVYQLSIGQMIVLQLFFKLMAFCLAGVLLLALAMLPVNEGMYVFIVLLLASVCFLTDSKISYGSSLVFWRDSGLFRLSDAEYWFKAYYVFIPHIGNSFFVMGGVLFPIVIMLLKYPLFILLGCVIYKTGYKESSVSSHGGRLYGFRLGTFSNEFTMMGLHKKAVVVLMLIIASYVYFSDSAVYLDDDKRIERDYVRLLNQKTLPESAIFLEEKQQLMDELEGRLSELNDQLEKGEIDSNAYGFSAVMIQNQLRFRELIENLTEQSEELYGLAKEGTEADYDYVSFTNYLFNDDGIKKRAFVSFLTGFFVIVSVMTVFPSEKKKNLNELLGSCQSSDMMIFSRLLCAGLLAFVLNLVLLAVWLYRSFLAFGLNWNDFTAWFETGMQTLTPYRNTEIGISAGMAIVFGMLIKSVFWSVAAFVLGAFSLFFANPVFSQILGLLALSPLIFLSLGVDLMKNTPQSRMLVFGMQDAFLSARWIISLLILLGTGMLLYCFGKRKWVEQKG